MKLKEAMKVIQDGWMRKLKGFRVHFQKRVDSEWMTDYFPDEEEKPLTSEVAAWEVARRFAKATKSDSTEISDGDIVNIYVVDELSEPVNFYGTNEPRIFNDRDIKNA